MANKISDNDFPIGSLVPKAETGVLTFLQKYPEFDGRDVTIAVLDSGIDPRAAGLQNNSDGSIKVIERFDCSGCGDTNTQATACANGDGIIIGLSGKPLKITNHMKETNIDGNIFRIGLKSLCDLYPSKIRGKAASDAKLKTWDEPHKKAMADVARQIHSFELENSESQNLPMKDKLIKEDLEASLELLNNYEKKYLDINTTYDCVLYRSEKCWKAVIDTTENGDLENGVLIGEYSVTHEVKNIDDYLSISINVHDFGDILEIVGICTSHGTHVTSITSGNHPNKNLNGVAPNAKIIGLTIGEGRLGSMETGTALARAIIKVMELCNSGVKVDVINTSYGEHAHWSNSGRVGELMNEAIDKYGVVWVSSAGNFGPALCTIGAPPDISQQSIIGVGAYVSPQMMEAEYTLREKLPANVYTWTSRDPCVDGGRGVTVCAPGAAIASVPEYTMTKAQLMNGTSMASPHVAGAIALLISGLKAKGIKYSPYSIIRAVSNTATLLNYVDIFAQGHGLLNVDKAFDYLIQYYNQIENLIKFTVKVGPQNAKGIHLRQSGPLVKPYETNVTIEPVFLNEDEANPKDKINFNVRLNLVCSEPWVQCGAYLDLCYSPRTIVVHIDPTSLYPGIYTASVKAYDSSCIEKGALFEIPITLVQPHVLDVKSNKISSKTFQPRNNIEFKPNTIQRDFILVPNNATWAVLKMVAVDNSEKEKQTGKFFVNTMQILPMKSCKALTTMKILPVNTENETVHAFKVEQNNILELCIAKYWSSFGETMVNYSLEFHGIASINSCVMHHANGIHRIDLFSLGNEELLPQCQLKNATIVLKPNDSKISPLTSRDIIPNGRQIYQNVLTYNLHLTKSQEMSLCVPLLCSLLYESEYESQLWMLFDSNKMMVCCGDAYSNSKFIKIDKGDYTIRLQIRHEKKDFLEKISEATMLANIKLPNQITLDIYDHYNQAIISGKKISAVNLSNGMRKVIYITPLTNEKLNKSSIPQSSSWLSGTITYAKDELGRKCDINTFTYLLCEGSTSSSPSQSTSSSTTSGNKKSNDSSPAKKNNRIKYDDYKESLRDFNCSIIPKLDQKSAEKVFNESIKMFPNNAPLINYSMIQNLESHDPNKGQFPFTFVKNYNSNNEDYNKTLELSKSICYTGKSIIEEINKDALLAYYGLKNDNRSDAAKIKSNMDKQKNILLDTLTKVGISLCKLFIIDDTSKDPSQYIDYDDINEIYMDIGKFCDVTDSKVIHFSIWHAHHHEHYGRMAKYLQKLYEEKLNRQILDELSYIAAEKNWPHVEKIIKRFAVTSNPLDYRPF